MLNALLPPDGNERDRKPPCNQGLEADTVAGRGVPRFTSVLHRLGGLRAEGAAGPPLQRVTGPFVILTTVTMLGSGIMLVAAGNHLLAAGATRWLLLSAALAGGLGLALATYHLSAQWGGSGSIIP